MPKQSAGILLYRFIGQSLELFLVHPGGPFFKNKDVGVWSIPKGEFEDGEEPLDAAKREFEEETGSPLQGRGEFIQLTTVKQKSGKIVHCWAVEGDIDHLNITSNTFQIEWPPRSGRMANFPEIDRAGWFEIDTALEKIIPAQALLLHEVVQKTAK